MIVPATSTSSADVASSNTSIAGSGRECTGDRDPLRLTAGQARGLAIGKVRAQPDLRQHGGDPFRHVG